MKSSVLSLLIVLLISASPGYTQALGSASSDKTKLVGQVVDSAERVPITSAFVVIHGEEGQQDQMATVDSKGHYEIELIPGYYNVLVGAREFAPTCKRIEIFHGRTAHFSPKLSPDFEHLEQTSSR